LAIDYQKRDGVAYITLNNPAKANIFDKATSDEISAAWIDLWEDREIRCAILTGAGDRHFCGGHNLAPRENITPEEREYLRTQRIFWPLAGTVHGQRTGVDGRMGDHYPRVWKPVIAAVNGWAAGAGLYVLLSSTDIRIASAEHARFKFALTTQGWLGHGPGASLLIKQLRYIDAMKMLLTDDPVDAAEALRIGLINEVVPHAQLMERAEKIARHIVTMPPVALRMMKEFVVRFGDLPTDQAWHVQNLINNLLIQVTTDGEEGRQAFNEKRPPNFTGALRRRGEAWEEPSEEDAKRLRRRWEHEVERPARAAGLKPPRLVQTPSPYRSIVAPLLKFVLQIRERSPNRAITVVIPALVEAHWWDHLMHTRRAHRLRQTLLRHGGPQLAVVLVPWTLEEPKPEAVIAAEEPRHRAPRAAERHREQHAAK